MTAGRIITDDEFADMFSTFRESAFRLETRERYAITIEREGFRHFLAGNPLPPEELPWWQEWLVDMRALTTSGKRIERVRILSDPPTDYQRWELWGTPWHLEAGELIRYMSRQEAESVGLSLDYDWWLFDDERLVVMLFTDTGEIHSKTLVTNPAVITVHRRWRDLATGNASPAERFAA